MLDYTLCGPKKPGHNNPLLGSEQPVENAGSRLVLNCQNVKSACWIIICTCVSQLPIQQDAWYTIKSYSDMETKSH